MSDTEDKLWDEEAGCLVRPYTISDGRTLPSASFDLLTLVMATGKRPQTYLGPDHEQILALCGSPVSVAEVAAHMSLPAVITKILLSDLVEYKALTRRAPRPIKAATPIDRQTLEAMLHGLRARL
ncbi:DUF742 domain-containing protein [Streptomyces sp. NPDC127084]|uniref:DUF742 domain-containing protein n=1 Tax=Streptomyces sp. NPDC127084 TaxID=3347133 RepID=UPI003660A287